MAPQKEGAPTSKKSAPAVISAKSSHVRIPNANPASAEQVPGPSALETPVRLRKALGFMGVDPAKATPADWQAAAALVQASLVAEISAMLCDGFHDLSTRLDSIETTLRLS